MEEMYEERQSKDSSKFEEEEERDENVFEIYKKIEKRETDLRSKTKLCQAASDLVISKFSKKFKNFKNFYTFTPNHTHMDFVNDSDG